MEPLGDGIWTWTHPFSTCGVHFGTRTTVVNTDQGLVLISPGPLDEAGVAELRSLGPVTALVAPNKMHHLFLNQARQEYPEARVFLAPGLAEKRPDLQDFPTVEQGNEVWGEVLDQIRVRGLPDLEETVFFHRRSRTLVLTDLAFNFTRCDHWLTRQVMRLNGCLGTFGPSRLLKHAFVKDRQALRESLQAILDWDFERVVVGHGEILHEQARPRMKQAFAWLP